MDQGLGAAAAAETTADAAAAAAAAFVAAAVDSVSRIGCLPDNPIFLVEELMQQAEAKGIRPRVAQELAMMRTEFVAKVLYLEEIHQPPASPKAFAAWFKRTTALFEKAALFLCGGGALSASTSVAAAAAELRSSSAAFGGWGIETRLEVMADAQTLAPLGMIKQRVLSYRGEPFLVIVDHLFRCPRAAGAVGSVLLRRAAGAHPRCRVVLCTVRPADPPHFALTHEEHERTLRFYAREGFGAPTAGTLDLLRCLASDGRLGQCAAVDGPALLALANQEGLGYSLPVLECDTASPFRPIAWHQLGGPAEEEDWPWVRDAPRGTGEQDVMCGIMVLVVHGDITP